MEWDTVFGLEVHAQLKTQSKLFSGSSTAFGASPNSQTGFIDAGLPGVLPVLNQQAVIMAIQLGLALNADINDLSVFERKNYFYPDLPKGYQISQFQKPIISNGELKIILKDGCEKRVTIVRAHLEEDAGKSLHELHYKYTGIDLNRAGTALLEIVTAPCLYSSEEVITYLKSLHQLVRFLGICDGNMQEGSFRCDVNISIKPKGSATLGTRTELKNLNSFRNIEKAIAYEYARHRELLENGQQVTQETRLYDPDTNMTQPMRDKENENDYRYFPDPDLLPIAVTRYQIAEIKNNMPELPEHIYRSLVKIPELNDIDISFILSSPATYYFFKEVKKHSKASHKMVINWLKGHYAAALNEHNWGFEQGAISPQTLAILLDRITEKVISSNAAKTIFNLLWAGEQNVDFIIEREGLMQRDNNEELAVMVKAVITEFPQQVADYKGGKDKLLAFFVGQVMKRTKGQGNPEEVSRLLKELLSKS